MSPHVSIEDRPPGGSGEGTYPVGGKESKSTRVGEENDPASFVSSVTTLSPSTRDTGEGRTSPVLTGTERRNLELNG